MSRNLFVQHGKRPILVCSLTDGNPDELGATIRNAIFDGADGFLLHLERLPSEFLSREVLSRIFSYGEGRPFMTLNYRYDGQASPDELMALQLEAVEAGAACVDLPADMYGPSVGGYTDDPKAVERQKAFIGKVHARGAQVLCSYHQFEVYVPSAEILPRAASMAARGADFVKIAQHIAREDQLPDAISTTIRLNREMPVPSLHILFGGIGRAHRALAPVLGSSMVLCVQRYTAASHKDKPLLRATRDLYDNLDFEIAPRT